MAQISTATNLQSPDLSNTNLDSNKFFTNLYAIDFSVSPEINSAIIAFFQDLTGDMDAGLSLAGTVIYSAIAQGLKPMQIVDDLKKLPRNQLDSYLTAFLNINRAPTSALGTKTPVEPDYLNSRSILL